MNFKHDKIEHKRILYWGLRALAEKKGWDFQELLEIALQRKLFLGEGYERNCRGGKMSKTRARKLIAWLTLHHPTYAEAIELICETYFPKSHAGSQNIFDTIKLKVQALEFARNQKVWTGNKVIEIGGIYFRLDKKTVEKVFTEEYERQAKEMRKSKEQINNPMFYDDSLSLVDFLLGIRGSSLPSVLFEKISGIVFGIEEEEQYKELAPVSPYWINDKDPEEGSENSSSISLH